MIKAEYSSPAFDDSERNAMHAKKLENKSATHGTPALFVRPRKRGALPLRAMNKIVREETYRELFPAEMTERTIRPFIRCAAGRIPASVRAIVRGELAVLEPLPIRRESVYGIVMPIKNIIPVIINLLVHKSEEIVTYQHRRSECARIPDGWPWGPTFADWSTLQL